MTEMMTVGQTASALGLSRSGIRWLFDTDRLRGHRAGRYRLIPLDEVRRMKRMRDARSREQVQAQQPQR